MPANPKNSRVDSSQSDTVSRQDELLAVLFEQFNAVLQDSIKDAVVIGTVSERTDSNNQTAERVFDPNEGFANWLSMTLGHKSLLDLDEVQLEMIRKEARRIILASETGKSVIALVKNLMIGEGIWYDILPYDNFNPTKLQEDPQITLLTLNWRAFTLSNQFELVLDSWLERLTRDGESLLRLFPGEDFAGMKNVPQVRFVDPTLIKGQGTNLDLGVFHAPGDYYKRVAYQQDIDGKTSTIEAKEVIHQIFDLGMEMLRGVTPFFSVLTNLRRMDKNAVNLSVLTAILSAIAFVRKHNNATLPQITKFLQRSTDTTRNINGNDKQVKYSHAGTVLDATGGTEYQFPAHTVSSDAFIKVIELEAKLIASPFNLPYEWLMSKTIEHTLTEDSPTAKRYKREQNTLFVHLSDLFWRVQTMMGVKPELRLKYYIKFNGPTIGSGEDLLSRARASEIEQRGGTLSPQTWAKKQGRNYLIERKQAIQHRETRQPGEVMPGDAGNTNVTSDQPTAGQGGNGTSE